MKKLFAFCCVFLVAMSAAWADPLDGAYEARILPGWRTADGTHMAALEIRLAPGWKTYWRAPGDGGIPPEFDWRRSKNLSGVQIGWPTPKPLEQNGMLAIGYSDRVIFPLKVIPKRENKSVRLSGEIELGVCKDICVPVSLSLSQVLPADETKPDPSIAAAMADRPYSAKEARVQTVSCGITPVQDGLHLQAEVQMPSAGGRETVVIEAGNAEIWVAPARSKRVGNRLVAETELYHVEGRSFALNRSALRITVLGKSYAVDIQGCPAG